MPWVSRKEKKVRTAGVWVPKYGTGSLQIFIFQERGRAPCVHPAGAFCCGREHPQCCPSKGTELLAGSTLALRDTVGWALGNRISLHHWREAPGSSCREREGGISPCSPGASSSPGWILCAATPQTCTGTSGPRRHGQNWQTYRRVLVTKLLNTPLTKELKINYVEPLSPGPAREGPWTVQGPPGQAQGICRLSAALCCCWTPAGWLSPAQGYQPLTPLAPASCNTAQDLAAAFPLHKMYPCAGSSFWDRWGMLLKIIWKAKRAKIHCHDVSE